MRRSTPQQDTKNPVWFTPAVCFFWFGGLITACFHGIGVAMILIAIFLMALDKHPGSAL